MVKNLAALHIITIDDLGMSHELDIIAIGLIKKKIINRVSIVTNLNTLDHLKSFFQDSDIAKDIHLNCTESSLQFIDITPWFLTELLKRFFFLITIYISTNKRHAIQNNWDEQIQKFFLTFGTYPDGINSHEHIHLIPKLFPLAIELCEKYNIPFIRLGHQSFFLKKNLRVQLLAYWHHKNICHFNKSELLTSATIYSFNWKLLSEPNIKNCLPPHTELIFHPQYVDDLFFLSSLYE